MTAFLSGGVMQAHDWDESPLGPPDGWPSALQEAVRICVGSRFPIVIWWGRERTMLYNDAYGALLGDKHPAALGGPGASAWPEAWASLGPALDRVMAGEVSTWAEDELLMVDRRGYREEAYFTSSHSPIEVGGEVAGVFTAVTETTRQVLAARRMEALARMADRIAEASSRQDVARAGVTALGEAAADIPFALLYLVEDGTAHLAGARGLHGGGADAPERVELNDTTGDPWGFRALAFGGAARMVEVNVRTTAGADVTRAFVQPVVRFGSASPAAILVQGLNPLRELDDSYRDFLRVTARQMSVALAGAEGLESEQARGDALAELDRVRTEFFSNVSHEFRTPLTLMLGPMADALADPVPELGIQRDRIELANRSALRLLRLVNTLLDFARLEAGRSTASFIPLDLGLLAVESASVFRAATDRAGIELSVDVPKGDSTIEADPDMLEKMLLNLLSNAFKFTFEGRISVSVSIGERAVIEVSDTGTGIPEAALEHLFERFSRVEGADGRSDEGSGIGLALVGELVHLHGGEITVTSRLGEGSTFRIELPMRQEGVAQEKHFDPVLAAAQRAGYAQEALRWDGDDHTVAIERDGTAEADVLVVDDNADLREYLTRVLAPRYAVRTAIDGVDALEQLGERPADLVVTDVMMPRMNGFDLIERLREDPATRRLPVIMLSARAGEEATVQGLDAGADDYLVKPFSGPELVARVHANLEVTRLRDALAAGERERARELAEVALTLQRSLLPHALPDVVGAELAGRYVPAGRALEVGGDFYDATALSNGSVVVAIGDVAGHGLLAAAVMGQVRQALRAYALEGHPPAMLMDRLDRVMEDDDLLMTTCLCGIFAPGTGVLRYANAGHPPPLLRRADGTTERLEGGLSRPLGVAAAHGHVEAEVQLAMGDALLLYTDGLVERRGESIDIGIDGLAATLERGYPDGAAVCDGIVDGIAGELSDDVAILALRRVPMAGETLCVVLAAHPGRLADLRRRLVAWLAEAGADRREADEIVLAAHEAATNAIEHAYGPADAEVVVTGRLDDGVAEIEVRDQGDWRESRSENRGRGQALMSALVDEVTTNSGPEGSVVRLRRRLRGGAGA